MRISGFNITMNQGDSESISVRFRSQLTGEPVPLQTGDRVCFTVDADGCPGGKSISKLADILPDGNACVILTPEDTCTMQPGSYFWSLRILFSDGTVTTPVKHKRFIIR